MRASLILGRLLRLFLALVLITALAVPLAWWWFGKRPEPAYRGTRPLPGLGAPVTVVFGPHAVPTIRAESVDDLLFTQGWLVAAERMWQMDLLRRLAGGRLAEVFGPAALDADRYFRTIGLPAAAAAGFAALAPQQRRLLERYAAGVNAYRAQAADRLPLEYRLAGFTPAPWTPTDSLVIGEYMAWINAVNLREELSFLRLAARLGNRRALDLFPTDFGLPAPADAAELPDYQALADPAARWSTRLDAVLAAADGPQAFSNAWAVTGRRSADGGALLANDPHLAAAMPAIWYLLELEAPGLHVAGAALPGVPLVLIGHNADLAWGITAAVADVQDLFVERLAADGAAVQRPDGAWEPLPSRTETIPVAGRDTPVVLTIRASSHGVLIDDLVARPRGNPEGMPAVAPAAAPDLALALATPLGEPERALAGLWQLNTATTLAEARAAVREFRHAPLNFLLAHRDGGIAWQMSGLLPVRGRASGAFPAPGWVPGYRWTGFRPLDHNPGVTDPPAQRLVSANHRMLPPAEAAGLGHTWLLPFRAWRIQELLDAAAPLTLADMVALQQDRVSAEARLYLAALDRHLPAIREQDPAAAAIAGRLADWGCDFAPDSAPAALFVLLKPALYEAIFGDELGPDLPVLLGLDTVTYGPLVETLNDDQSAFWDDVTTAAVRETAPLIWARALTAAAAALNAQLPDPAQQRLSRLRTLTFPHAFNAQPWLGRWFNVGPVGMGGDNGTVNVANASPAQPRAVNSIPSLRVVYQPADWSRTTGVLPLGQSGHRFSPYRTDQLALWLSGEGLRWPWNGPAAAEVIGTLRLLPPGDPSEEN